MSVSVRAPSPPSFAARKQRTFISAMKLAQAPSAPSLSPSTRDREIQSFINKTRNSVTLGAIRSKVKHGVLNLEKDVTNFQKIWLDKAADDSADTWSEFVKNALQRIGHYSGVKDYVSFEIILSEIGEDEDVVKKVEYTELKDVCIRSSVFSEVVFEWRTKLVAVVKQNLDKYCLSLAFENEVLSLHSVDKYENARISFEKEMSEYIRKIDTLLENIQDLINPFSRYLENYGKVLHYMNEICAAFISSCIPAKKWLVLDECYVANLQTELSRIQTRKHVVIEAMKKLNQSRDDGKYKLFKEGHEKDKLLQNLKNAEDKQIEISHLLETKQNKILSLQSQIQNKKNELDLTLGQSYRPIGPKVLIHLAPRLEILKTEIQTLENKILQLKQDVSRLHTGDANVSKEISQLIICIESNTKHHKVMRGKLGFKEKDIYQLQAELKVLEAKIEILQRIKELKTSSDTIRKINGNGLNSFISGDMKGQLEAACKLASDGIHEFWRQLYCQLPFSPDRDYYQRQHDIKVIESTCQRWESYSEALTAFRSLQKWQRVSQTACINDLLFTLRSIGKGEVALSIERTSEMYHKKGEESLLK